MCNLGIALGLAKGVAQVSGQQSAARKNREMIRRQTQLQYAGQERQALVEANAANKEGYQARLEADRSSASIIAMGEGMRGPTSGLRVAEQSRQGALSIANARDRADASRANYQLGTQTNSQAAQNMASQNSVNPLTAFTNIATAGMQNYGAFK